VARNVPQFQDTLSIELRGDTFLVSSESYLPRAIWGAVNQMGGEQRPDKRSWMFPISRLDEITEKLTSNDEFSCPVNKAPRWVRKILSQDPRADDLKDADIDKGLMPFQRDGVIFVLKHGGRALIADEMGLGKTVQALCVMKNYRQNWPVLVVCPSSLRFVWKESAYDWIDNGLNVQCVETGKSVLDPKAELVVISYHLLAANERFLLRPDGLPYEMVICDESQYIKDPKTKRTISCMKLCKQAKRLLLLSGTPALNRSCELYTQMCAILPDAIPSYTQFCERYAIKEKFRVPGKGGRVIEKWGGAQRKEELHQILIKNFMIRRLKKDVLNELPSKRRAKIMLSDRSMDSKAMKAINELLKDQDSSEYGELSFPQIFKLSADAKVEAVAEYIDFLLETDVKFLLFAHHHAMLDRMEEVAKKKLGSNYIRIDGKTSNENRPPLIKKFQENPDVRVAVLSITACGQGLTLTAASIVVFAELYWVPGQLLQAEDRVHRIGQKNCVNIQYLIAPGTLDNLMYGSLQKKSRDTTGILDGVEKGIGADERGESYGVSTAKKQKEAEDNNDDFRRQVMEFRKKQLADELAACVEAEKKKEEKKKKETPKRKAKEDVGVLGNGGEGTANEQEPISAASSSARVRDKGGEDNPGDGRTSTANLVSASPKKRGGSRPASAKGKAKAKAKAKAKGDPTKEEDIDGTANDAEGTCVVSGVEPKKRGRPASAKKLPKAKAKIAKPEGSNPCKGTPHTGGEKGVLQDERTLMDTTSRSTPVRAAPGRCDGMDTDAAKEEMGDRKSDQKGRVMVLHDSDSDSEECVMMEPCA